MSRIDVSRERSIHDLTVDDLVANPLWDTVSFDVPGGVDLTVAPVIGPPEIDGSERMAWALCNGHLADGTPVQALANVFLDPPRIHCPELILNGRWYVFFLPPAPSFVLEKDGPGPLSNALGRRLEQVFPISLQTTPVLARTGRPIGTVFTSEGPKIA